MAAEEPPVAEPLPGTIDVRPLLQPDVRYKGWDSKVAPPVPVSVPVEVMRLHHVRALKRKVKALCTEHGVKLTTAAYERWQFVQGRGNAGGVGSISAGDPLIPAQQSIDGLKEELVAAKVPLPAIEDFAEGFLRAASKGILGVKQAAVAHEPARSVTVTVLPKEKPHSTQQVALGWGKARTTLNALHLAKLYCLFHSTAARGWGAAAPSKPVLPTPKTKHGDFSINIGKAQEVSAGPLSIVDQVVAAATAHIARVSAGGAAAPAAPAPVQVDPSAVDMEAVQADQPFLRAAMALCVRYEGLAGGGFQAACPAPVFELLRSSLGVTAECFASPNNARFPTFASAFPDTDGPFGSLGSFFSWSPTAGSFEANPPFVPELMGDMVTHMERLLASTPKALSFVVVIPAWTRSEAWRGLSGSSFRTGHWLLGQKDHGYTEGSQQWRRSQHRISTCDTSVFLLQTPAGAAKWPVPIGFETALRAAFVSKHETVAQRKARKAAAAAEAAGEEEDVVEEGLESEEEVVAEVVVEEQPPAPLGGVKRGREEGGSAPSSKRPRKRKGKRKGKKKQPPVSGRSNFAALMAKGTQ